MPVGRRGDDLRLVRHQLRARPASAGGRLGQLHARRGPAAGPLEGAEQRAEQLPGGQPRAGAPWSARRRRSRARGRGWRAGGRRPTAARPGARRCRCGSGVGSAAAPPRASASIPAASSISRLSALAASETTASSASSVEQGGVAGGGLRQDRRDAVEALELLGALGLGAGRVGLDAGPLLADQQGDDLELGPHRGQSPVRAGRRASTSRTARASTGMMPSLSRSRTRRWLRGAGRRAPDWRWPRRATDSSSGVPGRGLRRATPVRSPVAGAIGRRVERLVAAPRRDSASQVCERSRVRCRWPAHGVEPTATCRWPLTDRPVKASPDGRRRARGRC